MLPASKWSLFRLRKDTMNGNWLALALRPCWMPKTLETGRLESYKRHLEVIRISPVTSFLMRTTKISKIICIITEKVDALNGNGMRLKLFDEFYAKVVIDLYFNGYLNHK